MKHIKGIVATSHIDSHSHRLARSALVSLVDQINSRYVAVGLEHDPRIAPLGRFVSAELVELDDGEIGVQAEMELFENGDSVEFRNDGRTIPLQELDQDVLHVIYDRSYRQKEDQLTIGEIANRLGAKSDESLKKALDPVSILTVAATVILGQFFGGLLKKAGADCWDFLKAKVKELIGRKRRAGTEHLLLFQFNTHQHSRLIVVEVVLPEPSDQEIEAFFEEGVHLLDAIVPQLLDTDTDVSKVVLEYSDGRVRVLYAVRSDAVPLIFSPPAEWLWNGANSHTNTSDLQ